MTFLFDDDVPDNLAFALEAGDLKHTPQELNLVTRQRPEVFSVTSVAPCEETTAGAGVRPLG